MRPMRVLRVPLLHFLMGGALLFGAIHGSARVASVTEPVAYYLMFSLKRMLAPQGFFTPAMVL